jgi:hypothetical protein
LLLLLLLKKATNFEDRDGGHWQEKEVQQNGQLAKKGN